MMNDVNQIANAFKAAGEALLELGQLFEKQRTEVDISKSEQLPAKRKRGIKDKNAPKKNCSSYLHFCNEQRSQLRKEHPALSITEVARLLGEKWKALSEEDKKPYQQAANEDKIRYDQEMAKYSPSELNESTLVVKIKPTKPAAAKSVDAAAPESVDTTVKSSGEEKKVSGEEKKASGDKEKKKKKKKSKKNHKNKV